MSAALILHALTFILFGDYSFFRTRILENRWLFLLLSFWLLHVISLAWSLNLEEGWDAIRVRLSMVSIPFLYAGTLSFSDKEIYQWCKIFILTVSVIISLNIIHFIYINASIGANDIRQLSWFGSHIRFGILVAFSSAFGLFLWKKKQIGLLPFIVFSIVVFGYVIYSQTYSALLSLAIIVVVFAIYLGSKLLYFKWFFAGGLILI